MLLSVGVTHVSDNTFGTKCFYHFAIIKLNSNEPLIKFKQNKKIICVYSTYFLTY